MKALTRRVGAVVVTAALGVAALSGCGILGAVDAANDAAADDSGDAGDSADGAPVAPADDPGGLAKAPAIIAGIGQDGEYDCADQDVIINASASTIRLAGSCGEVTVNGESLQVTIDDATSIIVNGVNLQVSYGGDPEVTNNGVNVEVSPV